MTRDRSKISFPLVPSPCSPWSIHFILRPSAPSALSAVLFAFLLTPRCEAATIDFTRDIAPIFSEKCFACHGPDEQKRKASLRLDDGKTAFAVLPSGATALVAKDRTASALYQRITAQELEERMPPAGFPKKLTPEEIVLLGRWIDEGAVWARHWAFEPLRQIEPPAVTQATWPRNDIDHFILARLEQEGLTPSAEADRRTLIRRLSFDLLGLPPTPAEIAEFLSDPAPDAYDRLVDRLLASPRYGERWGRHWLDVAHYGDTHGYDKDKRRDHAWPYRDYVIRALNQDKPYGRFVEEQLAGDVLYPDDPDGIVALGFIAAGPWDFVGHAELREDTVDKNITRLLDRDDMVTTAMGTFTSMTVGCARCHDHKFDPISQREYYGLQAVFAGVDRADRAYDHEPQTFRQRQALLRERQHLQRRLRDIDAVRSAAKSPELEQVDKDLAAVHDQVAAVESTQRSPSNGYHSAVSARQDAIKWVQIDLGGPAVANKIVLVAARPIDFPDTKGFGFPHRFRIEASADPNFTEAILLDDKSQEDFPNPRDKRYEVDGPPVPVQYIRVTATKLWQCTNDYIFALAEILVEGEKGALTANAVVSALDTIEQGRWSTRFLLDGYDSRQRLDMTPEAFAQLAALKEEEQKLVAAREQMLDQALEPGMRDERARGWQRLPEIQTALEAMPQPELVYAAANDYAPIGAFAPPPAVRPVFVLKRGDVKQPADEARPGALACIEGLQPVFDLADAQDEAGRRAALARWTTDPRNCLTWRSIVNRVWHYHFGKGIIETPNDFGHMGAPPTHPELLDWLALEFLDHGQSLKWLHKLIVTSAAYRQVSADNPANAAKDSSNRFLWRMNRRQLDVESLRDAVLAVSGCLDLAMGGPGYDLFGFIDDHSPHYLYEDYDPETRAGWRRSIYRFIVRSVPDPLMETLDCADPSQVVPARNTTITALQALALMNNKFVVSQAAHFADRLGKLAGTPEEHVQRAYELALGRPPAPREQEILLDYAQHYGWPNACRVLLNSNEIMFVD